MIMIIITIIIIIIVKIIIITIIIIILIILIKNESVFPKFIVNYEYVLNVLKLFIYPMQMMLQPI